MEYVNCALCGADNTVLLFKSKDYLYKVDEKEFNVVKCKKCGLVYLNPRPLKDEIKKYYPKEYATHQELPDIFPLPQSKNRIKILLKKLAIKLVYEKKVRLVIKALDRGIRRSILKRGARVLDVGCGNGFRLMSLKYDWLLEPAEIELYGLEPDPIAAEIAIKHGLKIFIGELNNAYYPDNYFDLVGFHHSLEHVSEPLKVVKEVFRIIKPKGLVYVQTPDMGHIGVKIFKGKWYGICAPAHFYLFSRKTIKKLFRKAGFRVISTKNQIGPHQALVSFQRVEKKSLSLKLVTYLLDKFRAGVYLDLWAIKPGYN